MLAYILRRLALILPTLFGIMLINFVLVQFVPAAPRRRLSQLCSLVAMLLMAVVLYFTVVVAVDTWDELMPTLPVSTNWFLVPVALCALHCLLHLIALLWREPVRSSVITHE